MTSGATARLPEAVGILRYDAQGLATVLGEMGQPRFRTRQIVRWLYGRGAAGYDAMSDLPAELRTLLAEREPLVRPQVVQQQVSSDGTRKYLFRLADGASVEAVGLPAGDRLTVCFSTQVGCAMGCSFCATGRSGLSRDLGAGEMADQVRIIGEDFGRRVTNAVAMGQGEPFANYAATIGGLRLMNSPDGLDIGARHLSISTCGLIAGIDRLAQEPEQFTLAVSLHSAVQSTRDRLMPGVAGLRLPELREAIVRYTQKTHRRVTLEYASIAGTNDTPAETTALISFARGLLVHVNLIPVNPVDGSEHARGDAAATQRLADALTAAGIAVTIRTERGADIDAACGQLKQRADNE